MSAKSGRFLLMAALKAARWTIVGDPVGDRKEYLNSYNGLMQGEGRGARRAARPGKDEALRHDDEGERRG